VQIENGVLDAARADPSTGIRWISYDTGRSQYNAQRNEGLNKLNKHVNKHIDIL
jgi:hypothetical protein